MFFYLAGFILLAAIVWLAIGVWRIGAVSNGTDIDNRPGTALLLIDLQTVFWDDGPYADAMKSAAQVIILQEIEDAKTNGVPVIAVRQEWSIPSTKAVARLTMKGAAVEGSSGTELAKPFAKLADHTVVKRVQDGFETGELDALLKKLGIGKLLLMGLDTNHCVQKTALAARNRGYEVTLIRGGTLATSSTERAVQNMTSKGVTLQ